MDTNIEKRNVENDMPLWRFFTCHKGLPVRTHSFSFYLFSNPSARFACCYCYSIEIVTNGWKTHPREKCAFSPLKYAMNSETQIRFYFAWPGHGLSRLNALPFFLFIQSTTNCNFQYHQLQFSVTNTQF